MAVIHCIFAYFSLIYLFVCVYVFVITWLLKTSGDSSSNVQRLEKETGARISHLKNESGRVSHDIVNMLLKHVTTVTN